ncbi:ParB N-terminal domain-containing protein [Bosea sp. RAF48]|uniref:ParB N-terminal domain-containing protein n=1 Tax=Bosea sp. RAF48 TaxID=3237480 RepID=UPI003F92D2D2
MSELSPRNAHTHALKQIHLIAESIEAFGFVAPIMVDKAGEIVAGHDRYEAAGLLGISKVPVVCPGHLGPTGQVHIAGEGGSGRCAAGAGGHCCQPSWRSVAARRTPYPVRGRPQPGGLRRRDAR